MSFAVEEADMIVPPGGNISGDIMLRTELPYCGMVSGRGVAVPSCMGR